MDENLYPILAKAVPAVSEHGTALLRDLVSGRGADLGKQMSSDVRKSLRDLDLKDRLAVYSLIGKVENEYDVLVKLASILSERNLQEEHIREFCSTPYFLAGVGYARRACDEELQEMWARLLAQGATEPDTVSLRALNLLSQMSSDDAQIVEKLSSFVVQINNQAVGLSQNYLDTDVDVNSFESFWDLHSEYHPVFRHVGLVEWLKDLGMLRGVDGFMPGVNVRPNDSWYIGSACFRIQSFSENTGTLHCRYFTSAGTQLLNVCTSPPDKPFLEKVQAFLKTQGFSMISCE